MPKVRALTAQQAKNTLANKFAKCGFADRLRQLNTNFGLRSLRVFVVWVRWTGERQGDGLEQVIYEQELLPTPKVTGLDGITWNVVSAGKLPDGSIRLDEVSLSYKREFLTGRVIPVPNGASPETVRVQDRTSEFFYEVRDDGRDEGPCDANNGGGHRRMRFRLLGEPMRKESMVCWSFSLQRMSEDRSMTGEADSWGETA